DSETVRFAHLRENLMRAFRHEAERRHLEFGIEIDPALGPALSTDPKRLQQILKNLLSNAFKFTQQGSVRMRAYKADSGWSPGNDVLGAAGTVVALEVSDTGIGISPDKQKIVFEAFQQADAGTSRQFGGTGLGLAISREIAGLLGGELHLRSEAGRGSTFTLYLPLHYAAGGPPVALRAPPAPGPAPAGSEPPLLAPAGNDRGALQRGGSAPPDDALVDRRVLVVDDDV